MSSHVLSLASEETDTSVRLQRKKIKSFLPFSKVRRPTIIFKQNDMNTPHKSKHTNPFLTAPSIFFPFLFYLNVFMNSKKSIRPTLFSIWTGSLYALSLIWNFLFTVLFCIWARVKRYFRQMWVWYVPFAKQ